MKGTSLVLSLCALAALAATGVGAEFLETFESYEVGSGIMGQGGWTTWNAATSVDTIVTDDEAYSGSKSLLLTGSCDIIRVFRTVTFGLWTVKARVFVSSDQAGATYFILMNTYNDGGPFSWSVQLAMDPTKGTIVSDMSGGQSLPLVKDEWVEIIVELDLDNNLHSIFYNDQEFVNNAPYKNDGKTALECIDLYSADNPGNKTFIDDVEVSTQICYPVEVERTGEMVAGTTTLIENVETPAYAEGGTLAVTLTLSNVRGNKPGCTALGDVTLTEELPDGWTATDISNGGTFADGKIVWQIPAAQVAPGQITYKASGPVTRATLGITGTVVEKGNALVTPIGGAPIPTVLGGLSSDGLILSWLLLGPYVHPAGMTTNATLIQRDYLTDDGDITEANVMPAAGDEVDTAYGVAASTGLAGASGPNINPNGIPMWFAWRDKDVQVNFDDTNLFGAVDTVMCYAVCYICADDVMDVTLKAGSDDSIQILVNEESVWTNPVDRPWPGLVDVVPVTLKKGINRLMVKVFENGGGWNFGVSLTDADGAPIADGVLVTLDPQGCGNAPPPPINLTMGDVNNSGKVDIADAVALLGYLFAKKTPPGCAKGADANDDDQINIADAISILGFLFSQKEMYAPDHSVVKGSTTCKGYAADGNDGKPYFPEKVTGLDPCVTQCTP